MERKTEEVKAQQDELNGLEEELKAFQKANRELVDENFELRKVVEALSVNSNQLGTELSELKVRCIFIRITLIIKSLALILTNLFFPF